MDERYMRQQLARAREQRFQNAGRAIELHSRLADDPAFAEHSIHFSRPVTDTVALRAYTGPHQRAFLSISTYSDLHKYETALTAADGSMIYNEEFGYGDVCGFGTYADLQAEIIRVHSLSLYH